jgi:hypothetical protein
MLAAPDVAMTHCNPKPLSKHIACGVAATKDFLATEILDRRLARIPAVRAAPGEQCGIIAVVRSQGMIAAWLAVMFKRFHISA